MAIKVTDLTPADIRSVETRDKLHDVTDTPSGPTMAQRATFAAKRGLRNVTKYWPVPAILEACYLWNIEPVLGQGGAKRVKQAGGLEYAVPTVPTVPAKPAPAPVVAPAPYPAPTPVPQDLPVAGLRPVATPAQPTVALADGADAAAKLAALRALIAEQIEQARGKDEQVLRDLLAQVASTSAS